MCRSGSSRSRRNSIRLSLLSVLAGLCSSCATTQPAEPRADGGRTESTNALAPVLDAMESVADAAIDASHWSDAAAGDGGYETTQLASSSMPSAANDAGTQDRLLDASAPFPAHHDADTRATEDAASSSPSDDAGSAISPTLCDIPQAGRCDPVAQCGCEDGFNCAYTPDRSRQFTCLAPGTVEVGSACDLDDQCTRGSACVDGLCASTCRLSSDCEPGGTCVQVRLNEAVVSGIRICSQSCDPLLSGTCGEQAVCALLGNQATPTCIRQRANGQVSQSCSSTADCAEGLGCTNGVCRQWCSVDPGVESDAGLPFDAGADAGTAAETSTAALRPSPVSAGSSCPARTECEPISESSSLGQCGAECVIAPIEGSECGVIPRACGCGDGFTCQVAPTGIASCGVPGPNGYMAWCDKNTQCAAGLSCLSGLCRPNCEPGALECPDQGICLQVVSSNDAPIFACMGHCDPLAPKTKDEIYTPCGIGGYCAPGYANDPNGQSFCASEDTSHSPRAEGAACGDDFDCQSGLGCNAAGTCQAWCRLNAECPSGQICDPEELWPRRFGNGSSDALGMCRDAQP